MSCIQRYGILFLSLLLLLSCFSCGGPSADPDTSRADAPDFAVLNADGETVRLSDLAGKPVVLNFWASWCPPCKSEMPAFEEMYRTYGDRVHFVMVNLTDGESETVETAKAYIAGQGYTFPLYFDTDSEGAVAYRISSIPTTCFIDADGRLVDRTVGALSKSRLEAGITSILPAD